MASDHASQKSDEPMAPLSSEVGSDREVAQCKKERNSNEISPDVIASSEPDVRRRALPSRNESSAAEEQQLSSVKQEEKDENTSIVSTERNGDDNDRKMPANQRPALSDTPAVALAPGVSMDQESLIGQKPPRPLRSCRRKRGLPASVTPDKGGLHRQRYENGTTFCKDFDGEVYTGKIVSFDPESGFYHVLYPEDEDEEDIDEEELEVLLRLEGEPTPKNKKRRRATATDAKKEFMSTIQKKSKLKPVVATKQKSLISYFKPKEGSHIALGLQQATIRSFLTPKNKSQASTGDEGSQEAPALIPKYCIEPAKDNGECHACGSLIEAGDLVAGEYNDDTTQRQKIRHDMYHEWEHLNCWHVPLEVWNVAKTSRNHVLKYILEETFCSAEMRKLVKCNYRGLSQQDKVSILDHIWSLQNRSIENESQQQVKP